MSRQIRSAFLPMLLIAMLLAACGSNAPASAPTAAPAAPPTSAAAPPTTAPAEPTAAPAEPTTAAAEPTAAAAEPTAAAAEPTLPPTNTPVAVDTFDAAAAGDRVVIKWYVGLGTGGDPLQIAAERKVVEDFNKSQDKIYLALQIVSNNVAYTTLATQIAAGNVPDIVGPVGTNGRAGFNGQFLDISELIKKNNVDLSVYDPALIEAYNYPNQGQIGLPFAVFPSFIFFNKDLFDEAGLAYPPQKFGDKYEGKEWNFDTLREIAMKLTVDSKGNDATSPDFNPDDIVQFGFELQYGTNARPMGTMFGANSFVGPDGKATIPDNWLTAWKWFYKAMFEEHWMPTDAYRNGDLLSKGNTFNSGKVAMAYTHLWYTGQISPPSEGGVKNWDIAVVPSYQGKITAKLHADTFVVMKGTKHPDEAFQVYQYLINNKQLFETYGALPAIKGFQADFFKTLDTKFAPSKINWQVAIDSLGHPDIPNHEEELPNSLKSNQAITDFSTLLTTRPGLDIDAEAAKLKETLQGIFDEK